MKVLVAFTFLKVLVAARTTRLHRSCILMGPACCPERYREPVNTETCVTEHASLQARGPLFLSHGACIKHTNTCQMKHGT